MPRHSWSERRLPADGRGRPPTRILAVVRLILVRHADAHAGLRGIIAGPQGCRGLTDLGRRQAAALRDRIEATGQPEVDVLLTSLLPRAIETASIIAPALGFESVPEDCDLCEVHTGEADGLDWAEYTERFGSLDMLTEPERVFAPGGESWNGFHDRVDGAMARLGGEHPGATVMAVSHAGVIAASLRVRFGGPPTGAARLVPSNTGMTVWELDDSTHVWTLRTYDDAQHLEGLMP
jgi:broad specificity phosphatase PhoE